MKQKRLKTIAEIIERLQDLYPPDHPKHSWAQGVIVTLNAEAEDPPVGPP